ncbi:oleosin L-like [Apium graveolens]|uniref:oleosin L-like n=1 Tax=Apium graveolens TaxID=4045 RepID=UPI003D7B05F8
MATTGRRYPYQQAHEESANEPKAHKVVKAATAVTAGGSLLLLSGLTLAGTVMGLAIATPLVVIFSPVLVPAAIFVFLIISGFLASGGFGVAAVSVLSWIYKYLKGGQPAGADTFEQARMKLAARARELKEKAEHATST